MKVIVLLRKGKIKLKEDVQKIKEYFESDSLYQFLDKPHSNLLFDIVLNQLAYPMHNNILHTKRFQYIAKTNCMLLLRLDINISPLLLYPATFYLKTLLRNLKQQNLDKRIHYYNFVASLPVHLMQNEKHRLFS